MPGTFRPATDNDDTQHSSDSTEENIATVDTVSTSMTATSTVESTTEVLSLAAGGTSFYRYIYIIIGVGGGIIIVIVCILIGFYVRRKRKSTSKTFITDTMLQANNGTQKFTQDRMLCFIIIATIIRSIACNIVHNSIYPYYTFSTLHTHP